MISTCRLEEGSIASTAREAVSIVPRVLPYAAVLGMSVALNLYLLLDRDRASEPANLAAGPIVSHAVDAGSRPQPEPEHPHSVSPAAEKRIAAEKQIAAPSSADSSAPSCETRLSLSRAEVSMLRSELDNRLTIQERFDRGRQDSNSDKRFRSPMERILKGAGISDWELECRDQICKLHTLTEESDKMEWLRTIVEDKELRGSFRSYQVSQRNLDAGDNRKSDEVWFQLLSEE